MIIEDWHTHSEICHHAVGSVEDYIKKAVDLNLNTIGICDHFPYEFLRDIERIPYDQYAMSLDQITSHLLNVEKLREKYNPEIKVKVGFEIDYFEKQEDSLNKHLDKILDKLDYIIGSVHILNFKDNRGAWGFDDSRFREDYKYYGPDEVYLEYYKTLQKMLDSDKFKLDIVGHFDLPKKFNDFPENNDMIFDEIMKTLEMIKRKNIVMEINTGGLRKEVNEQYPSERIIRKMQELEIPILLGSDAHAPEEVGWAFDKILILVKKIGYRQLVHFNKRKRTFVEI
ncbi:MAG: histidinol-phosphatase HisJ [Promethearchaeota archaeon]|nr:MAG: histidinol-phosphatase HisJ [Candidatus Lokiarchaeota archaeon]